MRKTKSTKEVAAIIGTSEANVRKLFENARDKVTASSLRDEDAPTI